MMNAFYLMCICMAVDGCSTFQTYNISASPTISTSTVQTTSISRCVKACIGSEMCQGFLLDNEHKKCELIVGPVSPHQDESQPKLTPYLLGEPGGKCQIVMSQWISSLFSEQNPHEFSFLTDYS